MRVHLAPGEALLPGTREAAEDLLGRDGVGAVLLPLRAAGDGAFSRAVGRHLARWEHRLVHPQTWFAPGARVAAREPLPGPLSAQAAPFLAAVLDGGGRVEALATGGVASGLGRDLSSWKAWAEAEGHGWGRLASSSPRFSAPLPALDRRGWWRHNVAQAPRRVIEILEASRRPDPLLVLVHLVREAAFARGTTDGRLSDL